MGSGSGRRGTDLGVVVAGVAADPLLEGQDRRGCAGLQGVQGGAEAGAPQRPGAAVGGGHAAVEFAKPVVQHVHLSALVGPGVKVAPASGWNSTNDESRRVARSARAAAGQRETGQDGMGVVTVELTSVSWVSV